VIFVVSRIIIENVKPILNDGEKSIKRICGETVRVSADIFSHGHETVKARIAYKHESRDEWRHSEMKGMGNDTWEGSFTVSMKGTYIYTVEAWSDTFTLWLNNIAKWKEAGENIAPDLLEGILLIREKCHPRAENEIAELEKLLEKLENGEFKDPLDEISRPLIYGIITKNWAKDDFVSYEKELTVEAVEKAKIFRSWYEMFPRSQGTKPNVSGTFRDCINRLPDIADMGFDLI
jgi:starch synthase (maltosyl-transferring)